MFYFYYIYVFEDKRHLFFSLNAELSNFSKIIKFQQKSDMLECYKNIYNSDLVQCAHNLSFKFVKKSLS